VGYRQTLAEARKLLIAYEKLFTQWEDQWFREDARNAWEQILDLCGKELSATPSARKSRGCLEIFLRRLRGTNAMPQRALF
jgi:hypothetical protein